MGSYDSVVADLIRDRWRLGRDVAREGQRSRIKSATTIPRFDLNPTPETISSRIRQNYVPDLTIFSRFPFA
jgi:hypothetical protein